MYTSILLAFARGGDSVNTLYIRTSRKERDFICERSPRLNPLRLLRGTTEQARRIVIDGSVNGITRYVLPGKMY